MRILHVINSVHPAEGGTVECVSQMGSCLTAMGDQVRVASCGDKPGAPWLESFPLPVQPLGPGYGRYAYSPRVVPWIRSNIEMFDAIIVNGLWQYQGLSAFRAVAKSHVPYFVYAHGMLDPWSRRAHPFRYAKKFAYWLLFTRRFLRDAAAVIFTSDEEAQLAKGFFPGSDWNGYVVGNGIAEPPPFSGEAERDLMNRFPELHGRRVLLFLGRLHEKKGLDLLLRAFAATKPSERNLHLLICGSGEAAYEHALHSLAASLGLADRITWAGLTLGDAKWAALRLSELFVLASHQENFGIAIVEALAVGTPVLISDKVNIYRTIEQHGAGLVCDDNEKSLTAALSRWDSMSMEAKRTMRADARDCFHAYYSAKSAANKLRACIAGHVQERSKGRSKCA